MAAAASAPGAVTAVLRAEHVLHGVSAASGLELLPDGRAFVAGDDSVFLYQLQLPLPAPGGGSLGAGANNGPSVLRKLRLTASREVDAATGAPLREEGIAKKAKPDFEAIAALALGGATRIAVFGSGSKAGLRDGVALLDPETGEAEALDAGALMGALRRDARVTGAAALNLEAAALLNGRGGGGGGPALALFQRGNVPGGANSVIVMGLADFEAYLGRVRAAAAAAATAPEGAIAGTPAPVAPPVAPPPYRVVHLRLPPLEAPVSEGGGGGGTAQFLAGVSSASTVVVPRAGAGRAAQLAPAPAEGGAEGAETSGEELLVLAASYEATLNEIDDGEVLGSRVALLPAAALLAAAGLAPGSGRSGGATCDAGGVAAEAAEGAVPVLDLSAVSALILTPGGSGSDGAPALAKVEGVAARGCECGGNGSLRLDVLAVTDPDGGASQLLEVAVTAPLLAQLLDTIVIV